MYKYVLSDLKVASEFKLLIAKPTDFSGPPDVTIIFHDDIGRPENPDVSTDMIVAAPQDLWFFAYKNLSFRIRNGTEILIQESKPETDAESVTKEDINLYIVGSAFGILCLQRGLMPIHCSSVEFEGKAVAFTGSSGVGKSTLAAALSQLGFAHVCDDVFVIDLEKTPITVTAMPKGLKLWDHAAEVLEISPGARVSSDPDFHKSYVSLPETSKSSKLLFDTLYVLDEDNADAFSITEMTGVHKLLEIRRAIYRSEWLDYITDRATIFEKTTKLAHLIKVYSFKRPDDLSKIKESAKFLASHFTQSP